MDKNAGQNSAYRHLYPMITPFDQRMLDVGDGHSLYVEQCGNPDGLPVVVLVLNDASLALIEMKQGAMGLQQAGVRLGRADLPAVARGFGGYGVEVADAAALEEALRAAMAADRFTLISARIEAGGYRGAF